MWTLRGNQSEATVLSKLVIVFNHSPRVKSKVCSPDMCDAWARLLCAWDRSSAAHTVSLLLYLHKPNTEPHATADTCGFTCLCLTGSPPNHRSPRWGQRAFRGSPRQEEPSRVAPGGNKRLLQAVTQLQRWVEELLNMTEHITVNRLCYNNSTPFREQTNMLLFWKYPTYCNSNIEGRLQVTGVIFIRYHNQTSSVYYSH